VATTGRFPLIVEASQLRATSMLGLEELRKLLRRSSDGIS
jgi:hypothetical protein